MQLEAGRLEVPRTARLLLVHGLLPKRFDQRHTLCSMHDLSDYELEWSRDLFVAEAKALSDDEGDLEDEGRMSDAVELLLTEAFTSDHVAWAYRTGAWQAELPPSWLDRRPINAGTLSRHLENHILLLLLEWHVDELPTAAERRIYWSRRTTPSAPTFTAAMARRVFVRLVDELYDYGYFDRAMPKGCPVGPARADPDQVLTEHLARPGLWPLRRTVDDWDDDTWFDLIELLHDLATRPKYRWNHDGLGTCGGHYERPSRRSGQRVYRSRVNELLDRCESPYRLAQEGEDVGRLVVVADDARDTLSASMVQRADPETGDDVRHAVALFRARGASVQDRRSAIVTLAGVLERRRELLKHELLRKDENALFEIANRFALRHQHQGQQNDYDAAFLDWIFWWYLATIDLTDCLVDRQATRAKL